MRKPLSFVAGLLMPATVSFAQNTLMEMPKGYDAVREGVTARKLDSIQDKSSTILDTVRYL